MYEVVTGELPFGQSLNQNSTYNDYSQAIPNECRPKIPNYVQDSFRFLIQKCLANNPKDRPSFSELFILLSLYYVDNLPELPSDVPRIYCLDDVDLEQLTDYIPVNTSPEIIKQGIDSSIISNIN